MSSLYSTGVTGAELRAVITFAYPDISAREADLVEVLPQVDPEAEQRVFEQRLEKARADGAAEAERRLRRDYELRDEQKQRQVQGSIAAFGNERKHYFERAESEVVRLALAIAAKILHREAQVDPMMVAALVRLAVEKMDAGTRVTARVPGCDFNQWRAFFGEGGGDVAVEVNEDPALSPGDCILQTELGDTDFSIESQLKEVERGFFDLLAHRPGAE